MAVHFENRLPEIGRSLRPRFDDVEHDTAEQIARQASASAPRLTGLLSADYRAHGGRVMAVDYYHFVEFGTGHGPAQPHLMPAAEAGRVAMIRRGKATLGSL